MAALEDLEHGSSPARHPLAPGATAPTIREHLLPEDRNRFDDALAAAQASGDAEQLAACLERWRRVAIVERDREQFGRVVRRAARRLTGEDSPPDEPLAVSRMKARM